MRCYDALLHADKPDLGIDPCYVYYYMHDGKGGPRDFTDKQLISIIQRARGQLVCWDQEIFGNKLDPMYVRRGQVSASEHEDSKRWFRDFVQRVRGLPGGSGLRLGFYGLGSAIFHPHREKHLRAADLASIKYTKDDANRLQDTGITDLVDVLMPTYYNRSHVDTHPAEIADQLAIASAVFERPICPFVSGNRVVGDFDLLPDSWIKGFIKAVRPFHDDWRLEALILWGGYKQKWDDPKWVRRFIEA